MPALQHEVAHDQREFFVGDAVGVELDPVLGAAVEVAQALVDRVLEGSDTCERRQLSALQHQVY